MSPRIVGERHLIASRENDASSPCERMRRRLGRMRGDEASPRSPIPARGDEVSPRSPVLARGDVVMPRPRARRRGVTSFSSWKTRRCLVLARGDEASPRCLVSTRGDTRRPIPVGPHTGILSDRYVLLSYRTGMYRPYRAI
ncbi:hypothetical protein B296_00047284 [Ensete ventricosum]|uniref:Uncharacterized protein n=1 Tax=Ensete ventricosum TaxID=4639 RepID=A0A426YLS4_ENSVE|nr:hypothetical protein B296_00047284 [Ensete ventricosum]